ncbi:efflux RND transporter permease subunit [Salipiger bermudensis]|uniref:efflux RND transporter permease subunit n=1 Tax=Salipiger bermudensis TaxID=344736 RepID=UPI001CD4BFBB|nr:efflux RND transporter permease subunit [Salipiger bermudensis]MCA0962725.1 efflux RND transporter permease subunit [Salipiger bermudensis]
MRQIPGQASGILSYFTRHPTVANLLLVILVVAGLLAGPNMRAQFFPDVIDDDVSVNVRWDGAGAEDVDSGIVQLLEPTLLAVEGVVDTSSMSREGSAEIELEFEPGYDMMKAVDDVETAIDTVTDLPEDADDPTIRSGGWRDRVTDVVITGPVAVDQLGRFADEFVVRLFAEGVTRTTIRGVAAPQVVVEVPSRNLIGHDVTMQQISDAIAGEVNANPAGDVSGANARVRTGVEKRSAEAIAAIVLRSEADGTKLTIGDVARVRREGIDRARTYFVGENPAISVRVDRSAQGDAIEIQRQVEEVARSFQASLPEGTRIDLIRTRAEAISGRLNILLENGAMGLVLVVVLLFLFLNARIAIWVAAGIPTAMLAALALMYASGLTINMISLFALIITLGILVDDAIVVGEHADHMSRHGLGPVQAAETAAQRMALPVFSSTLTTIIAFLGLTAIGGRFGDMIQDIPFTVIMVLIASLVECFLILPNHMAHAIASAKKEHWYDLPSRLVNRGFRWVRERLFRPLMVGVIRARYVVLALAVLAFASQVALFIRGDVQWRFFNSPEQPSISGNYAMAPGATREDTLAQMRLLQQSVDALGQAYEERYGRNPIDYMIAEIGGNSGPSLAGAENKDEDQLGAISIELIDADLRPYSSFAFVAELQETVERHPLLEIVSFRGWRSGPGGDALDVQFYGADSDTLKAASLDLQEAVLRFPEVSGVEDNLSYDMDELVLELTPQGTALGFTIDALGRVLRNRVAGIEAATYPDGPRSAEIRVELPEDEQTADFLERMQMRTPDGAYVPLADIVSVSRSTGFSTVRRENGLRVISVIGDISEDDPARATEVMQALEQEILPEIAATRQVEWRLSGLSEQEDAFLADALTGLILVLLGIYLVLAWVFASWTRPLVVMSIIPFGLVGTIYGHAAWEVPLSMFTVVGLLGMTGIIINDSIVLVTQIDEYAPDRGILQAIVDGAADRLRPVFLTTATTVLGLAPLLYERSADAQFLKPTVITLCYGLGFGMVLVLLVVPALIAVQHDIARHVAAFRRGLRFRHAGVRALMLAAFAGVLCWLAATMGYAAVTGALWPPLALPGLAMLSPMMAGFLLFAGGVSAAVLVLWAISALAFALSRRSGSA